MNTPSVVRMLARAEGDVYPDRLKVQSGPRHFCCCAGLNRHSIRVFQRLDQVRDAVRISSLHLLPDLFS